MQTVKIGNTNWQTSNIALGIMRMGTLSVPQSVAALQAAHEAGINLIDSADIYGNDPELGRGRQKFTLGRHSSRAASPGMIPIFNRRAAYMPTPPTRLPAMTRRRST